MISVKQLCLCFLFCTGFQSAAGVSAASTVDMAGPTSRLARSEPAAPAAAVTGPGVRMAPTHHDRLTHTAPGALAHPVTGGSILQMLPHLTL